jgi:ribosomal protein S18 acetylase RimI-like enzyme
MANIEYIEIDEKDFDLTETLRQKLIDYHKERSEHFSERYATMNVSQRNQVLLEKATSGGIRIDLAKNADTGELVSYCISTISKDKQGEIESIYVEADYRGSGIGDELMKRALRWMDEHSVVKKILEVGAGNEEVIAFYSRHNFYPRTIILEQVNIGRNQRV